MSRFLLILLVSLSSLNGITQEYLIQGKVIEEDSTPIANCQLRIKGSDLTCFTNEKGDFKFNSYSTGKRSAKIIINDLRYVANEKTITLTTTGGAVQVNIVLLPNELPTASVFSGPQVVFKSDVVNVFDFEILDNHLLLLTYEKRKGHNVRLILTNLDNEILSAHSVNDDAKKIEKDYEGKLHLISDNSVYYIALNQSVIELQIESKTDYEKYLQPLVSQNSDKLYFSNYAWHYPGFSYFSYDKKDSTYKTLKYIEDVFMMQLYRAEYKYVDTRTKLEAYRAELRTGIDKEIWAAVWNGFPNSMYYKPLYAPMFSRNDSVMIFDHYANQVYYFDKENNLLDSVAINYHLGKEANDWKKLLLMDDVTKKIYNVFEHNGIYSLVELNQEGKAIKTITLKHKYPGKIKVHGGAVYFNYRPFESAQNKFLYKQEIG